MGVIVLGVQPGFPADVAGLQPGDIITRINRKPVTSLAAIVTAQADFVAHPDAALIEAQRDRETMLRILKP